MTVAVNNSLVKSIAFGMLALAFQVNSASAIGIGDDSSSSLSDVESILQDGISGATIGRPGGSINVPEGTKNTFEYRHTSDGIEMESEFTYGYSSDFGNYVNTTSKNVKVLDISSSTDAGISLGCSGLDLGAESLFKFDASDFLDDLKTYATTKLATEALAMIYATPLISTVMDGIKSMNNFVAEFEQASCDMATIQTRADEIRGERIAQCVNDLRTTDNMDEKSAREQCMEPGAVQKLVEKFQCTMSYKASLGSSLSEIFGAELGGQTYLEAGPEGQKATVGGFLSSLIPDMKFNLNDGSNSGLQSQQAQRPMEEVFDRAMNHARQTLIGSYEDITDAMKDGNVIIERDKRAILSMTERYVQELMQYGNVNVYSDTNSNNTDQYTAGEIAYAREDAFNNVHKYEYSNIKAKTNISAFLIGPDEGPSSGEIPTPSTSFTDVMKTHTLRAGELCFTKTVNPDGKYKWGKIFNNPNALFTIDNIESSDQYVVDAIIERLAVCNSVNTFLPTTIFENSLVSQNLAKKYVDSVAAEAAYATTLAIANATKAKIDEAINNSVPLLIKSCKDAGGPSKMPHTSGSGQAGCEGLFSDSRTDTDGNTVQPGGYASCEQYAEENKLTEEKRKALENVKAQIDDSVALAKTRVDRYKKDYNDTMDLIDLQKNSK